MPINVFLSVGRPFTAAQEAFIARVEHHLGQHGLRARTVGRTTLAEARPLATISTVLDRSAGALVIALERVAIARAAERRGAPDEVAIIDQALPTPWNQIEAALAYAKRMPLLVIKERHVRGDGLLDGSHDWCVHEVDLASDLMADADFAILFERWRRDVMRRAGWFRYRR